MRKPIKGTLQEADHNPVRVGDKLTFVPESKRSGPGGGGGGPSGPRPPRGPSKLDLFIEEQRSFNKMIINRFDEQGNNIKTIQTDINDLKVRMTRVEKILNDNGLKAK